MLLLLSALLLPVAPPTQDVQQDVQETTRTLERVAVVGASLSDGMFTPVNFADVLDLVLLDEHEKPSCHASPMLFTAPRAHLEAFLGELAGSEPTLLVGIDLPFWFGYGEQGFDGGFLSSGEERLASLRALLARLEEVETPMILGDFPDMSDAVGLMLRESQVPTTETLDELNRVLREWADRRENVRLLPLARMVREFQSGEGVHLGDVVWPPPGSGLDLVQGDRLHPTVDGLALLGHGVVQVLVEAGWAAQEDFEPDVEVLADALRERAGLPRREAAEAPATAGCGG